MSELSTQNTLRERVEMNRVWFWLLLSANRWALALSLTVAVFGVFMLWGVLKPVPVYQTMQGSDMVETVFAGLVGAIITTTTLVVSINQLVLSQEIGSLGTQRTKMDRTMDFRQNTDELLDAPTPNTPAGYLHAIIETTEQRAETVRERVADTDSEGLREAVDTYVADLVDNAGHATDQLDGSSFGDFTAVSPALDFNYDKKIYDIRRIGRQYRDELTESEEEAFRRLLTSLSMYGPVREYVKDLYIQWALVRLSRAILYAAIPAFVVAGGMVVFVDPTTFPGTTLGIETILWVVSAAFAFTLLPFFLFTAYILRLATLAKQTLTIGPLNLS